MAYGKLESTFHNDPKFRLLSEALGLPRELGAERGAALARGFVSSIWSWATDHAPDGHLPDACRTTDVERVAGWPTARGRLYSALVAVGFIDETPTERGVDRVLHRFWERSETRKAAKRKKEERDRRRAVTGQSQPPPPPRAVTVTPIREENRIEEERERRDPSPVALVPDRDPPPDSRDLTAISASQIPAAEALELWKIHQHETLARKLAPLPMPVGNQLNDCRMVLARAGRHMALATRVMEAFVRHNGNDFWSSKSWPLWCIARERDFNEALDLARKAGFKDAATNT